METPLNPPPSTRRTDTATHTRAAARAAAPPLALGVAGLLVAVGGLLHPEGEPVAQLSAASWPAAHGLLLVGIVVLVAGLAMVAGGVVGRVRTTALVAAGAAALSAVEMVPHMLASTEAHAVEHAGAHPFYDVHMLLGPVANAGLGLSIAALAIVGVRVIGGGPVLAAVAVVGGVAFALAAPLIIATGIGALGVLFSGSVLIGAWLVLAGVLLWRRR